MKWFMSILVGIVFSLALGFSLASVDCGVNQMIKSEPVGPFILFVANSDDEKEQDDGNNTIAGGNATA